MKVSNVLSFAALVALVHVAGGSPAHAWTDEQLENRGREWPSTSSPSVSVAQDSLLVLRKAGDYSPGVASKITQVERQGASVILGLVDGESVVVPYFSEYNAEQAYLAIRDGASIDVATCLSGGRYLSAETMASTGCTAYSFTAEVSCRLWSSTPLIQSVDASAYALVGVRNNGLTTTRVSCRPHPGKI